MNKIFFFLCFNLFIGCSNNQISKQVDVPQPQPTPVVVVKEIPKNLDLRFHEDLSKVWSSYFYEDYTDTRAIDIFVVTNRNVKNNNPGCGNENFGVSSDPTLHMSVCRINVPKNHSTGEINFAKDNRQSSHEFFKNVSYKNLTEDKLIERLKLSQRMPLVFVHGFNVRYQEAILRAAQLAYDLKYQGPIVLFSWPAGAGDGFLDEKLVNVTYKNNSKSAQESIQVFKNFLNTLSKSDIKVNLVVHSMGHQVVLPALNEWSKENQDAKIINELILNAPDFEIAKFSDLMENLRSISRRITLYCSYNDNAIAVSEVYNNNKRLGACALIDNIDSINVSQLDAPTMGMGLGHGYYSSRPILSDVFQVLLGLEAEKRLFIRKSEPNSTEKYFLRP